MSSERRIREWLRDSWPARVIFLSVDFCYDAVRFLHHSTPLSRRPREAEALEAQLLNYCHRVEKGLTLSAQGPPPEAGHADRLAQLMDAWVAMTGDLATPSFQAAYGALREYADQRTALTKHSSEAADRVPNALMRYSSASAHRNAGGTLAVTGDAAHRGSESYRFFKMLAHNRHSARSFADAPVPSSVIEEAVATAIHSPSACNRQCWRVHVYSNKKDIARVLEHQDGHAGFGHRASHILVISGDLRAFVSSRERNELYVDVGMFAMSLVYAFEALGVGSCCLNICNHFTEQKALRRSCRLPTCESPVLMVAIGYPPPTLRVTASERLPTSRVLRFRRISGEQA